MLAASRAVSVSSTSYRPALRALLLVAALLLTMVALGACQQQPPPPPTAAETPPPTAEPAPPPPVTAPAPTPPGPVVTGDVRVRVGLLLPLSGQHAALGQSMLRAAEMALFDAGNDAFALVVEDTEGPGGAVAAAQAVLIQGSQLILGPLFAQQVTQIAPIARNAGVPVISFSTDRSVAGDGVYVMGILPELQIRRVVTFAVARGFPRVAALLPNSTYGRTVAQALNVAMLGSGGSVGAVEFYDTASTDMAPYVQRLAGARAGYDALLIPEGGDRLRLIAPLLPFYDIHAAEVKMLGSTLWDDPRLGAESGLAAGWFAAPPAESWHRFEQRYGQLYGAAPARLASLAYDGTALAAVLAREAGPEAAGAVALYDQPTLTRGDGFAGIDGIFRFMPDGTVERGLAVMELQYNQIITVDPAPQSFPDVIF
jgi:ABC-type branched-subunit amino acid transport system substrate-binding protein